MGVEQIFYEIVDSGQSLTCLCSYRDNFNQIYNLHSRPINITGVINMYYKQRGRCSSKIFHHASTSDRRIRFPNSRKFLDRLRHG